MLQPVTHFDLTSILVTDKSVEMIEKTQNLFLVYNKKGAEEWCLCFIFF